MIAPGGGKPRFSRLSRRASTLRASSKGQAWAARASSGAISGFIRTRRDRSSAGGFARFSTDAPLSYLPEALLLSRKTNPGASFLVAIAGVGDRFTRGSSERWEAARLWPVERLLPNTSVR